MAWYPARLQRAWGYFVRSASEHGQDTPLYPYVQLGNARERVSLRETRETSKSRAELGSNAIRAHGWEYVKRGIGG